MKRWALLLSAVFVFWALAALGGGTVRANGAPIKIVLTYLNGVSNWGPQGATGVAELVMSEGEARVSASGLPQLSGETYVAWLVNTATNQAMSLGSFNADSSGNARLDRVLPQAIPQAGWNLLLLTVEPAGAAPAAPGQRHTIAGYFPGPVGTGQAPVQLPRTGASEPSQPRVEALTPQSEEVPPKNTRTDIPGVLLATVAILSLVWVTWATSRRQS